jgi:hypothetical protein
MTPASTAVIARDYSRVIVAVVAGGNLRVAHRREQARVAKFTERKYRTHTRLETYKPPN